MKSIKYIIVFSLLLLIINPASRGQCPNIPNTDIAPGATPYERELNTYWHYRYRLTHYFMKLGSKTGESIPADVRNGTQDAVPTGDMKWVDGGRLLGWYLMALATEYKLLKDNGQSTDETKMELYYALHAVFRLDSIYMSNWIYLSNPIYSPFSSSQAVFPGEGIMAGDDITFPGSYYNDVNNFNATAPLNSGLPTLTVTPTYTTSTTNLGNITVAEYGDGKVGPVSDAIPGTGDWTSVMSSDNYIAILMGLDMVVKLVDPGAFGFSACNLSNGPYGYNLGPQQMAYQLGNKILDYVGNTSSWDLIKPDFDNMGYAFGIWDFVYFEKPLSQLNSVFGTSVSPNFLAGTYWNNYTPNAANITCGGIQQLEMGEECAVMSDMGGAYSSACNMIGGFGNNTNGGTCPINQPDDYTTQCTGWDVCYYAIHDMLWSDHCNPDICAMQNMLENAPYHGPFSHISAYVKGDPSTPQSNSDYAGGGWASSRRFMVGYISDNYGNYGEAGNYPGVDYMVLFNLYYLLMEQKQQTIVINDASNTVALTSVDPYTGNITAGYPDVYPLDAIQPIFLNPKYNVYGTLSNPYTIADEDCSPIIVNKLLVQDKATLLSGNIFFPSTVVESGDLNLIGSTQSYIEIAPPSGSSATIEPGSRFYAICAEPCPSCWDKYTNYQFQADPDPNLINGADQRIGSYQKTAEFDTAFSTDAFNNFPNPFTTSTTIDFSLPNDEPISLYVIGTNGQVIQKLIDNETYIKGGHVVNYNGSELAAGNYLAVLVTKESKRTIKMIKTR